MLTRLRMDELVNDWVGGRDTPFQMGLLAVFEPGHFGRADGSVDLPRVVRELSRRAQSVPELGRRVVWTHLGEGRPVWFEDPDDDVARHVTTAHVPPDTDLASWAANRAIVALDRDRPPWRADVVDGLPTGHFAVLVVVHHILADGLAGMRLLAALLDTDPDAVRDDPPANTPPPLPTHRELLLDNLRARLPRDRRSQPTARSAGGSRRAVAQLREAMSNFSEPLPRTSLPRRVGPSRRMSVTSAGLDALRVVGHDSGATVNDLLLAAVANGLRDLLIARGECRESLSVRTVIPVARDDSEQAASMMVVNLPVGQPDPQRRLETIVEQTTARKADLAAAGATAGDMRALPVPIARLVIPWARRRGSARIHLSVTNVPGPADPLWFSGSQLIEAIPVPPLVPLVGLTVAALSYAGRLAVAVNADGAVKDLDTMGAGIATSLTQRPPPGRSRPNYAHRT